MRRFVVGFATIAVSAFPAVASAQTWPAKPIRFIVPLAAGGPGDVLARALGQKVSESVGQPVVIENRPGANTNIGNEFVAKAPADGYTVLMSGSTLTINPALYAKLSFDAITSFAPVTPFATTPLLLVVHPSLPVTSVRELIAFAKPRPGQLHFGSAGNGSTLHLAGEMLNTRAGIKLVHVPYKGVTGAFSDLLGGQIFIMFPGAPIALPQIRAGKLRALAATSAKRSASVPDLPTVAEAGVPGYEVPLWYGAFVPAGTPTAVVNRLHAELVKALDSAEIRKRWSSLGAEPVHSSPEEFAVFLKADLGMWAKVVRDSGAKID